MPQRVCPECGRVAPEPGQVYCRACGAVLAEAPEEGETRFEEFSEEEY